MGRVIKELVFEYARSLSVLVVDDDELSLDIYKEVFNGLFNKVDTASDGQEAYDLWNIGNRKYDLIITDLIMPNMDGFELINKIRLKSPSQHIIVLSAIVDINEMRNIIELGIDGILVKPYNQERMFTIFGRVLKLIHNDKLLKRQAIQLKLLAKENIEAKVTLHENKLDKKHESTKKAQAREKLKDKQHKLLSKQEENKKIENKYNIRASLVGGSAEEFSSDLDYFDLDRVEVFQDKIEHYQNITCLLIGIETSEAKKKLVEVTQGLDELIDLLNHFGTFSVTAEATKKLIQFIESIESVQLEDNDKKDLLVDGLVAILEDLASWIDMVFVQKNTDNINYFDASFANTCLELESIFVEVALSEDQDDLDFF